MFACRAGGSPDAVATNLVNVKAAATLFNGEPTRDWSDPKRPPSFSHVIWELIHRQSIDPQQKEEQ